jgi:alkanesulfonate monooxygenase SsuD/methylene tetrahydromethanopterin reductase-like flavin-dependent oxidoreductase (luciferase family)
MQVYYFTEQPYYPVWNDHQGSLRVNLPNRRLDPKIAGDLFHRYYDEWKLADQLGYNIMVNEHHQTATCMSSTVIVGLSVLARETKNARILVLGYPIGHRPDPLRIAEELATIDVISRGRLDMGFIKGVPYEFTASNQNPIGVMDRFWESHDFILKAMSSHDEPFNWEGEFFHYRHVNIWPRPVQEPHPPVWSTTGSTNQARVLGDKGYVLATLGSGYATRPVFDAYRQAYLAKWRTSSIVFRPFRNPPGFLSVEDNARALRGESPPRSFTKDGRGINMHRCSVQDLIDAGIMFCGTPDQVYEQIVDFCEYCGGMGNLLMMGQAGFLSHEDTVANLTLFAKEVMPRLRAWKQPAPKAA